MAVINSVGVGHGSKSVGEFTYRSARGGRTIAARRVIETSPTVRRRPRSVPNSDASGMSFQGFQSA